MTISSGGCLKIDERRREEDPMQNPLARLWVQSHPNRENVVMDGIHTRKQSMALNATSGFVCLPGGYGTLEELGVQPSSAAESHAFSIYRYWKPRPGYSLRFTSSVCRPLCLVSYSSMAPPTLDLSPLPAALPMKPSMQTTKKGNPSSHNHNHAVMHSRRL